MLPVKVKLNTIYATLLPAMWLNSLLGNQVWSGVLSVAGQALFWLSLAIAIFIVVRSFGKSIWPLLLLLLLVLSRIASLSGIPLLYVVYIVVMNAMFVAAGIAIAINAQGIIRRQFKLFFVLSLPIMLLQVAGAAEWLQLFNTLYTVVDVRGSVVRPDIELLPLLFTGEDYLISNYPEAFYDYLSMQSRPPGLTHSSAMLAVFILIGAAFLVSENNSRRLRGIDVVLIAVVVFSGSKLALLGFLLVVVFAFLGLSTSRLIQLTSYLVGVVVMLGLYSVLFPASIAHNFGFSAFDVSFISRGVDAALFLFPVLVDASFVKESILRFGMYADTDIIVGQLAGLGQLLQFLPILLVIGLLLSPWLVRGIRYHRLIAQSESKTSRLMIWVVIFIPFATPLFNSPIYSFALGIALSPFAIGISSYLKRRVHIVSNKGISGPSMPKLRWR